LTVYSYPDAFEHTYMNYDIGSIAMSASDKHPGDCSKYIFGE